MARIIAGRFDTQEQVDRAREALMSDGFQRNEISSFYVNPAGQHAITPIGGDVYNDEGTKDAGKSAASVAAIGSAAGLALGTAAGAALGDPGFTAAGAIAGAGVGGFVGALAGALRGSGAPESEGEPRPLEETTEHTAGMMIAVFADRAGSEETAVQVLRTQGATEIESAHGEWRDGSWADFDARRTPNFVDGPQSTERTAAELEVKRLDT